MTQNHLHKVNIKLLLNCTKPTNSKMQLIFMLLNLAFVSLYYLQSQYFSINLIQNLFDINIIMAENNPLVNYSEYQSHFNDVSRQIRDEPTTSRYCNDLPCTIIFFILTIAFLGIGIYEIQGYSPQTINGIEDELDFKQYWDVIVISVGASLIISFVYVFLIKLFTKIMVYLTMALSLVIFAALAVYGIIIGEIWLTISMAITLLVYLLVLICLWKKIAIGIVLVQLSTRFMSEKPSVFLAPIANIIITFIIALFWSISMSITIANLNQEQDAGNDGGKEIGFIVFYSFMWLFYMFLCYYIMTFTIAVVCSHWYYNIRGNGITTAYKWIFTKQFGSLVFAAILVAIVTFARMIVEGQRKRNKNIAVVICLCIIECLLRSIERLLKIINHYTVIMMALTGQSFVDGAKSTMGLLFQELALLNISNIICNFLIFWGVALSAGLPAILSVVMMNSRTEDGGETSNVIAIVVLLSLMVSMLIYQLLIESVGCLFIFYSMDKRFMGIGLITEYRLPNEMHDRINEKYGPNPYGNTY